MKAANSSKQELYQCWFMWRQQQFEEFFKALASDSSKIDFWYRCFMWKISWIYWRVKTIWYQEQSTEHANESWIKRVPPKSPRNPPREEKCGSLNRVLTLYSQFIRLKPSRPKLQPRYRWRNDPCPERRREAHPRLKQRRGRWALAQRNRLWNRTY